MSNAPISSSPPIPTPAATTRSIGEYLEPKYRDAFDAWRGGYKNPSQEQLRQQEDAQLDYGSARRISSPGCGRRGRLSEHSAAVFPQEHRHRHNRRAPKTMSMRRPASAPTNRWLADFCREDPDRRAGIGLILPNDLDEAVKDVEFSAKGPSRRRAVAADPADCTWLKPLYDPAWEQGLRRHPGPRPRDQPALGPGFSHYGEGPVPEALWISE